MSVSAPKAPAGRVTKRKERCPAVSASGTEYIAAGKEPFTTGKEQKEQRVRMNHDKSSSLKKRLQEVLEYLAILEQSKFTGYIRINYSQGAVGRIEKWEEILPKDRAKGA